MAWHSMPTPSLMPMGDQSCGMIVREADYTEEGNASTTELEVWRGERLTPVITPQDAGKYHVQ